MRDKRLYIIMDDLREIRSLLWVMKQENIEIEIDDRQYIKDELSDAHYDITIYTKPLEEVKAWLEEGRRLHKKKLN